MIFVINYKRITPSTLREIFNESTPSYKSEVCLTITTDYKKWKRSENTSSKPLYWSMCLPWSVASPYTHFTTDGTRNGKDRRARHPNHYTGQCTYLGQLPYLILTSLLTVDTFVSPIYSQHGKGYQPGKGREDGVRWSNVFGSCHFGVLCPDVLPSSDSKTQTDVICPTWV